VDDRCEPVGHIRQLEFPSTIKADLIRTVLDGEHATHTTVTASKGKLENPEQRIHWSRSRRRSQLPLASSQVSRERTLARARAIAQSAAP